MKSNHFIADYAKNEDDSEYKTSFRSLDGAKNKCIELKERCTGITNQGGIFTLRRGIEFIRSTTKGSAIATVFTKNLSFLWG